MSEWTSYILVSLQEKSLVEMEKHILPLNIQGQPHSILKRGFIKDLKRARTTGKETGYERLQEKS